MSTDALVILPDGFTIRRLSTIYPAMRWTARNSTGENIPYGIGFPRELVRSWGLPEWWAKGLWLFSEQGHGLLLPHDRVSPDGWSCLAYTRKHAAWLFDQSAKAGTSS